MAKLRTYIPETIPQAVAGLLRGGWFDTLWRVFILFLTLVVAFLLVASGPVGAAIGGILVTTLLSDRIRQLYGDLYRREFWIWRP